MEKIKRIIPINSSSQAQRKVMMTKKKRGILSRITPLQRMMKRAIMRIIRGLMIKKKLRMVMMMMVTIVRARRRLRLNILIRLM